jgi:hypothetical protein
VRASRLRILALALCSLAIAGCQGSASQQKLSFPAPPGGTAHLTVTDGAYSVKVTAGPASQSAAVLASSDRTPTSYSVLVTPQGSYSLRFSGSREGAQSWTVRLSRRPSWSVVVRGGTTHLVLDLTVLRLSSLTIAGGAYTMVVDLPPAQGQVPVRVTGGANRISFVISTGSSATMLAGPGVSRVQGGTLEGSRRYVFGSSGASPAGYQISVTGGAALVVLSTG